MKPTRSLEPRQEKALKTLFTDFLREKPLSLAAIAEVSENLTPEEYKNSFDSIATMRMRTLMAEGKPVQGYNVLIAALKENPTHLSLQLELHYCLSTCHENFLQLVADDVDDPMVETLYGLLFAESYLNASGQTRYLQYLVGRQRYSEAAKLAQPIVELYPALLGLRELIEEISVHAPDPAFQNYLLSPLPQLARPSLFKTLNGFEIFKLRAKFHRIRTQMSEDMGSPVIDQMLREILGELNDLTPIDVALKDFYYLRAIVDGNRGNHWAAIMLLKSLVEIDTCNLHFRRSMEIEIERFCETEVEKAERGLGTVDLLRAYAVLKEFAFVPFKVLKHACLKEVRNGNAKEAQRKMNLLLSLNPLDGDYLLATIDVALEVKDEAWTALLFSALEKARAARPWDMTIACLEQEAG